MKKIIQHAPLFLLTIPLVFLINAANHYYTLLNWSLIFLPLLLYVLLSVPVYFLISMLFYSRDKGGVYTGLLIIIFYFFSAFHQWLKFSFPGIISRYSFMLPLLIILLLLAFIYIRRSSRSFQNILYYFNNILLLLVAAGLLLYGFKMISHAERLNDQADPQKKLANTYQPCSHCIKPDIYYILLDGYTNSKTLQSQFGYNNSAIENYLVQKGFHVVTDSRSNYNFTHMSIASLFNLDYLHHLDNSKSFYTKEFLQSYYTIDRNEWCMILQKEGYSIRNYSIFPIQNNPSFVTPYLTELSYRSVPGQTFFNKLNRDIGWKLTPYLFPRDEIRPVERKYIATNLHRIGETFNGLMNESRQKNSSPRFIYAHFVLPHETFYFDSTGKRLPELYTLRTQINKKDYVNQVAYTNKFIIAPLIDSILHNATRPPVIIIQGDHGYRNFPPEQIQFEFENLNAVFFPGKNYEAFMYSKTSVNTFRIVLNNYFNQHLPLLKDSTINLLKIKTQ